jgi:tetratricopeptide (TPR) repeat protein
MTKHPTSSRVHRDDQVPDDAFVGAVRRIVTFTQDNRNPVLFGAAAILAIAAGAAWFIASQRSLEQTAQARLTQVQQSVASGNTQLAVQDLQTFLATFGSTAAADQARLVLAGLLIQDDRAEEAIDALQDLPERINSPFGLAAARLEASALETLGRYQEAADAYRQIARNARFPYQRRQALSDAARVNLQHVDPAAAADLYQQVLDTFDDQEAGRGYYEMWLAEARAAAQAPQAAGQGTADPTAPADSTGTR